MVTKTPARKAAPPRKPTAAKARKITQQQVQRQREELQARLRKVEADYDAAEKDRLAAESELDANEHHIADMQTAIERLGDELERARRELRQAQSRTRKLERALTRAGRPGGASRLDAMRAAASPAGGSGPGTDDTLSV